MDLEKQLAEKLKEHTAAQEVKMKALETALTEAKEKGVKAEDLATIKETILEHETKANEVIETMQKQMDTLATDLKKAQTQGEKKKAQNAFNVMLKENFEQIQNVSKTNAVKVEVKDMTLGNALTGDQPRDYNFNAVVRPAQAMNVTDLARSFPISGGTYTYTRSTLASGAVATQVEGSAKAQLEYDYTMVDANTDFIAGFAVYSRKMRNNLAFLENTLSIDLRRDYFKAENTIFNTVLAAAATASTQIITGQNKIEMLIAEVATLAGIDFMANAIVVTPADYYSMLVTEKSTGAGYGLPGVVTFDGGVLRINGIQIGMATWLPANKYYVGDWARFTNPVTEGFGFEVSESDSDNFRKNNITARVESQATVAVEQPDAIILGDFTAV